MKIAVVSLAACLLTSPALAGVLPISGTYCGSGDNADIVLSSDAIGGNEDGCTFKTAIASGPHRWVVSQKCTNTNDTPSARIEIGTTTVTVADYWKPTATYQAPITLHRCR